MAAFKAQTEILAGKTKSRLVSKFYFISHVFPSSRLPGKKIPASLPKLHKSPNGIIIANSYVIK